MVAIKGTKGNVVEIEIQGIGEVIRLIRAAGKQIKQGADFGVIRAGTFIQEEVKESVIGNRVEHKSVDTGTYANSIRFRKIKDGEGIVEPAAVSYPNGQSTNQLAPILEHSISIIGGPRRHFGNTKIRNMKKVKQIIEKEIKKKT